MMRQRFTFKDLCQEASIIENTYSLDQQALGLRIHVPESLHNTFPFNTNAYDFLQFLRPQILEYGLIEIPSLPLNPLNHTLAQRDPSEHSYSQNAYLTGRYQDPHQDTPPYPTAFWLAQARRHSATWVISKNMLENYYHEKLNSPEHAHSSVTHASESLHQKLVAQSLQEGTGILVNQQAGLLLIDNSTHNHLYHARTSTLTETTSTKLSDAPLHAFNEVGLLNYIDQLDERRTQAHRCQALSTEVAHFMREEAPF